MVWIRARHQRFLSDKGSTSHKSHFSLQTGIAIFVQPDHWKGNYAEQAGYTHRPKLKLSWARLAKCACHLVIRERTMEQHFILKESHKPKLNKSAVCAWSMKASRRLWWLDMTQNNGRYWVASWQQKWQLHTQCTQWNSFLKTVFVSTVFKNPIPCTLTPLYLPNMFGRWL